MQSINDTETKSAHCKLVLTDSQ